MAQQVRRQMNYVDGTAARQMYAAPARRVHEPERKAPSRRVAPQQRPQERPKVRRRVTAQTKKTLAFSAGYMLFMAFYGMSGCWIKRIDVISEYEDQHTAEQHQCLRGRT